MKTYLYRHNIPFQDTDAAGVVHFTKILGYAELAEHAFLLELGIPPISTSGGFPKVHAECDYLRPLRFRDEVHIQITLDKLSTCSLHWGFEISVNGEVSAKGKLITACVDASGKPCEITAEWQKIINAYPDGSVGVSPASATSTQAQP